MADFTEQQKQQIMESESWKNYVKSWQDRRIEAEPSLDEYLSDEAVLNEWIEKFKSEDKNKSANLTEQEMDNILNNLTPEEIKLIRESEGFKNFEKLTI